MDTTSTAAVKPLIGYGAPAERPTANALAANRAIQEPSFDLIYTFWKDPKYGALQVNNQISYFAAQPLVLCLHGQPKNARSTMVWSNLRWVLPVNSNAAAGNKKRGQAIRLTSLLMIG